MKYWKEEILLSWQDLKVAFLNFSVHFILLSKVCKRDSVFELWKCAYFIAQKRTFFSFFFFSPLFGKYSFRRNTIDVVRANKQMDVFECHYLMYNDIISFMKNSAVWAALVKEKEEVGKKK